MSAPAISRQLMEDMHDPVGPPCVVQFSEETGHLVRVITEADEDYDTEVELAEREKGERKDSVRKARVESAYARELLAEAAAVALKDRPATPLVDVMPAEGEATLIGASDIEPEKIDWLWPGWLARGKLEILAGSPGTLKTTIAETVAAALTTGGKFPDGTSAPISNVVMWSGEDSPKDTLLPRFIALGGNRARMHFVDGMKIGGGSKRSFDPATDMPALSKAVNRLGNVSMIIIDSIASVVGSQANSHNNAETRRALQPVVDLAERHNACVLGIAHYTKNTQGNDPLERVMGSIAFGALARIVLGAAKVRDDKYERILVRAKSNIGPDGDGFKYRLTLAPVPGYPDIGEVGTVTWGDPLTGSPRELIKSAEADNKPNRLEQATGLIETMLDGRGGRMPAAELKEAVLGAGFGENVFYESLKELQLKRKKAPGNGGRGEWIYELPPEKMFSVVPHVDANAADPNADLTGDVGGAA